MFVDIHVYNLKIANTNRGIAIMPRWGTGKIYNVTFQNIEMQTQYFSIPWWGSAEPIYITNINASSTHWWNGTIGGIHNITFTVSFISIDFLAINWIASLLCTNLS